MRWDSLFDDLAGQVQAGERADLWAEVADLARAGRSEICWVERCLATSADVHLVLGPQPWAQVTGRCLQAAPQWLVLRTPAGDALVPTAAVRAVRRLPQRSGDLGGTTARRLGLGHVLRRLARDRVPVAVYTRGLPGELTGTIDGVGKDHFDLAEHAVDEYRRGDAVRAMVTVPFDGLSVVYVREQNRP
ncbi:MAG: hypothetical protein CSA58_03580 [Micrococcales bacterium]|nr:MAG: hypothetical protein CSA58_03580 [Micrococcales bacterium]